MSGCDMRLAGICRDCMTRLGIDDRLTTPLNALTVSKLPEFDPKMLAGIQFPGDSLVLGHKSQGGGGGGRGTTKITYKIAKTVKESMEDAASNTSHASSKSRASSTSGSKH